MFVFVSETLKEDGTRNVAYEYPSLIFSGANLCQKQNISERSEATAIEQELFNRVRQGDKLNNEIRAFLRLNYTITGSKDDRI
jgi:hypothetical protein